MDNSGISQPLLREMISRKNYRRWEAFFNKYCDKQNEVQQDVEEQGLLFVNSEEEKQTFQEKLKVLNDLMKQVDSQNSVVIGVEDNCSQSTNEDSKDLIGVEDNSSQSSNEYLKNLIGIEDNSSQSSNEYPKDIRQVIECNLNSRLGHYVLKMYAYAICCHDVKFSHYQYCAAKEYTRISKYLNINYIALYLEEEISLNPISCVIERFEEECKSPLKHLIEELHAHPENYAKCVKMITSEYKKLRVALSTKEIVAYYRHYFGCPVERMANMYEALCKLNMK